MAKTLPEVSVGVNRIGMIENYSARIQNNSVADSGRASVPSALPFEVVNENAWVCAALVPLVVPLNACVWFALSVPVVWEPYELDIAANAPPPPPLLLFGPAIVGTFGTLCVCAALSLPVLPE